MADQYPNHEMIRLQNFTAFEDLTFEFSPTVNVLVGENGTGKTHLMKVLYALQYAYSRPRDEMGAFRSVERVFQTSPWNLGRQGTSGNSIVTLTYDPADPWEIILVKDQDEYEKHVNGRSEASRFSANAGLHVTRPVFIPAIDMMGHTRRFVSTFDEYQIDFDQTHRDIVALLLSPERRTVPEMNGLGDLLISMMGGTLEEEAERFYLRTKDGRLPMPLVGEGIRKIATLYQLIRNGLLGPGSVLFWDEPEVNVNPKLMDEIIDVLLRLTRSGVQIFLATHSYVLLKELDLQAQPADNVRYFALESTENGTVSHATDDYAQLRPNPIAEQFDSLYDRQLDRSLGRKRKP